MEYLVAASTQPLLDQLKKPGGLALGFVGVVLALVALFVLPQWSISAQWLAGTMTLSLGYVWISQAAIRELSENLNAVAKRNDTSEPRVIQVMIAPTTDSEIIILLEKSRLFGQAMIVSVYYEDERGFELYVASGTVTNIQSNGLIQITIGSWQSPYEYIRSRIIAQQADGLHRILVRPAPAFTETNVSSKHMLMQILAEASWQRNQDDGK
ncbi:MAG: hypothetical protein H7243_06315 [Sphingomonadaceae bacterium]|nr:hypothetical protein [Sphingomonadaceae bacterium]